MAWCTWQFTFTNTCWIDPAQHLPRNGSLNLYFKELLDLHSRCRVSLPIARTDSDSQICDCMQAVPTDCPSLKLK